MAFQIRNLTATTIHLQYVEWLDLSNRDLAPGTAILNIANNISSLIRPWLFSTPEVKNDKRGIESRDMSFKIDPFTTMSLVMELPNKDIARLVFEIGCQRYQFDCSTSMRRSADLVALDPQPKTAITAIYLKQHAYLALLSCSRLDKWMGSLRDEYHISALSIPGTHNSPTCYRALPSVRCQSVSPREQLENGIRFFDIRVQIESPEDLTKDSLVLVHGVFPISFTATKYFREVVNETYDFLDQNPSETVVFSIKREGTGAGTDAQLGRILQDFYICNTQKWYTLGQIPTLGSVRGKIVVMRRFKLDGHKNWCINAETWRDNTPNDTSPSGDVCVQDFYEVLDTQSIGKKIEFAKNHMALSAARVWGPDRDQLNSNSPISINFLSASNFWRVGCWPERIAAQVNPAMVEYLCMVHNTSERRNTAGDGSTGIVVCDWVGNGGDWDLVRCIIGMNSRLEAENHQQGHRECT